MFKDQFKDHFKYVSLFVVALICAVSALLSPRSQALTAAPIRIAVIDTGIDVDHFYLTPYINKERGWNFAEDNNDLTDSDGHGTHVAGIIRNTIQTSSPELNFELVPIKYYSKDALPSARTEAFQKALEYAIDIKAHIINISAGGPSFNKKEMRLLERAAKKGILIVASAGNKEPEVPHKDFYPASYELSNIISVAAVDHTGQLLPTSNLNKKKNNVQATGLNVYSSLPDNRFGTKTGSSQAAAVISGRLAGQIDAHKKLDASQLKKVVAVLSDSSHNSLFVSNSAN